MSKSLLSFAASFVALFIVGCAPSEPAQNAETPQNIPTVVELEGDWSGTNAEPGDVRVAKINGVELRFRWIPGGEFTMGDPIDIWRAYLEKRGDDKEGAGLFLAAYDETPRLTTLTEGCWFAETELTQETWEKVTGSNPSYHKGAQLPVVSVSWAQCDEFIQKLNGAIESSDVRFTLPTEAQWERACRAGTETLFSTGSDALTEEEARCAGDDPRTAQAKASAADSPVAVGSFKPNPWGLYDMHGNVWEWCRDYYGKYSQDGVDPVGPKNGEEKVTRGGSWSCDSFYCRSARRSKNNEILALSYIGMRLCVVAKDAKALREGAEETPRAKKF